MQLVCGRSLFAALTLALMATAGAAGQRAKGADLALEWQITAAGTATTPQAQAALHLVNRGQAPLPPGGWALYFTSLTPLVTPYRADGLIAEQVVGTLFRLRADGSAAPLPPGGERTITIRHDEAVVRPDKAPHGPYLAYEDDPDHAEAIGQYRIVPGLPPAAAGLERGGGIDPAAIFERNARIVPVAVADLPLALPTPVTVQHLAGEWQLAAMPVVEASRELDPEAERARAMFASRLPAIARQPAATLTLTTGQVPGQPAPEAYRLRVDPERGAEILGNTPAGVARGLETLRQLLPAADGQRHPLAVPAVDIVDAPRFPWRGLMVDVARNFQDKAEVMRLIELMAQYKLNRLHLHLTDDEGWRLAIRGLPELTGYGGRRGHAADESRHLLPAHGSGPRLDDPHGSGYYTADDFVAILRHAAARRIEVIPEIEMPGHARAAVKAMAYRARILRQQGRRDADDYLLSDPADASRYRSAQLHTDNVIDPGLTSTYRFIDHVIGEIARLYQVAGVSLTTVHVGGDELAQGAWVGSPASRRLMKRRHMKSFADLWDHFYERVAASVGRTGARVAGWEELGVRDGRGNPPLPAIANPRFADRGFQLQVWNNFDANADLANRLANAGYPVVLSPASTLYFDMAYDADLWEPGADWAGQADLAKVHDLIPFDLTRQPADKAAAGPRPVPLTDLGRSHIVGLEGTLFSEIMREPATIDMLLMPRLLALAERAWAADPAWSRSSDRAQAEVLRRADWSRFVSLLGRRILPRLDVEWPDLPYRLPPPGLRCGPGGTEVNHEFPGITIRYTRDGSTPTASSPVAGERIDQSPTIVAAAFAGSGRHGRVARSDCRP